MTVAIIIIGAVLMLMLGTMGYIYFAAFHTDKKRLPGEHDLPPGKQYEQLRDKIYEPIDCIAKRPYERVSVRSCDGLLLSGRLYSAGENAPVAIVCHGYRSNALRDCSGSAEYFVRNGISTIMIDQRSHGMSEGHAAAFGIMERHDCLSWIDYSRDRFGQDVPVILLGLSMGASSVLMSAGLGLPDNVRCILADCGFTSPKEIISLVINGMGLPPKLVYPLVRLTARIFCGFDLEATDAPSSLAKCTVPVILIHGEADDFVPCDMSRKNYDACSAPKLLITVPEAGHGVSFHYAREKYINVLEKLRCAAFGEAFDLVDIG